VILESKIKPSLSIIFLIYLLLISQGSHLFLILAFNFFGLAFKISP